VSEIVTIRKELWGMSGKAYEAWKAAVMSSWEDISVWWDEEPVLHFVSHRYALATSGKQSACRAYRS